MNRFRFVDRTNFAFRFGKRFLVIAATLVVGLLFLMAAFQNSTSPVAPKVQAAGQGFHGGASPEMLAYALDLRSGNSYAVFGGHGVRNHGNSTFRGEVASTGTVSGVASVSDIRGGHAQGRQDLSDAVKIFNQLPCEDVNQTELAGTTFTPGVYCLGSADLAGTMTMSGEGDPNAVFIFRVSGRVTASDNATIALSNGAKGTSVYFVSNDSISIGKSSDISANLIANGDISVGDESTVGGKVLSVNGDVNVTESVLGAGTGSVEICKVVPQGDPIGQNVVFSFTISGVAQTIQAPSGGCSAPFDVPVGNATITEVTVANTAVTAISVNPGTRAVSQSLALRQQVINVPEGGIADQTVVTYTNQTTRTGTLEICKRPLDSGVTGIWQFTVQGAAGTFAVPTGFCSGAITSTIVSNATPLFPINVTEIGRPNYRLENVTTFPTGRLNSWVLNPDQGGTANVNLVVGGGVSQQTTVNFFNRSLPGRIKVCKITADPVNIPIGTMFRFSVSGTAPTSPTTTTPGVPATVTVDVPAGPVAQGGFCQFAPGTWVIDTTVTVQETGLTPGQTLPFGFTFADTRVSRIRASSAPLTVDLVTRTSTFPAVNNTTEVEYTNFIFRPAILKICKVAGTGVAVGTNFTFNLSLVDPLTSFPVSTAPITVPAGSCAFASGPFPALEQFPGIGTFNFGTQIVVTEAAAAGVGVTSITSPSGGPIAQNLPGRAGTLTFNQLASSNLFNEIQFINAATVVTPPASLAARYDFDGDGSSDPVIFRPTTGTWWYAASGANNQFRAVQWGSNGDKVVAADYDGDGKSDFAVYRGGTWYIAGSAGTTRIQNFGLTGDIPQPGDYDGDGKADLAVYRPSDSVWYMMGSQNGFSAVRFGISTDIPEAADYDGDGRMDQAVYRGGAWYILGSTSGFSAFSFGVSTDIPVPADYNGDGKADASVFRSGQWYIRAADGSGAGPTWGTTGDVPVPADYDGDGRTDAAIFRPASNTWWILKSNQSAAGGGYTSFVFGSNGDSLMNY